MGQHLRGRLGPGGQIELVRLMREDGLSERQAAACLRAGEGASLVGARTRGLPGGTCNRRVGTGSLEPTPHKPEADAG